MNANLDDDENTIYDLVVEQARETSLFRMLEGGNPSAIDFKDGCMEYLKQQLGKISQDLEENLIEEISKAHEFTRKTIAENYIMSELSTSQAMLEPEIDTNILTSPWSSYFTKNHSILSMLMLTGHAVNLKGGLTKDLKRKNRTLFDIEKKYGKWQFMSFTHFKEALPIREQNIVIK